MADEAGIWDLDEGEEIAPGRYAVRRLGVSNTHEVYVAWDEELLGLVAIKLLRRDRLDDRLARKALESEGALLTTLQHPSLPRCFDACLDGDRPHLALELVEGPRMSTVIRNQRVLALEQVIPMALQICSALHYLSGKGLVHLDIKPKNVIMAPPPRVIDLSIARTVGEARCTHDPIGTDRYMAPEQCGSGGAHRIGPKTDIWGLGVTLFESLAGRRPFPEGDPHGDVLARFPQLHLDPEAVPREVPNSLAAVIRSSLDRDPDNRPNASEIVGLLDPLAEATPPRLLLGRLRITAWRTPRGR